MYRLRQALCRALIGIGWIAPFAGVTNVDAFVGKVSRACRNDQIPSFITEIPFSNRIPLAKVLLPGQAALELIFAISPYGESRNWWSLESFTTDYHPEISPQDPDEAKYWLWATSYAWVAEYTAEYAGTSDPPGNYLQVASYQSGWAAKFSESELVNSSMVMNFGGPKAFWRARAGTGSYPDYFRRLGDRSFKVQGYHFFWDPQALFLGNVGITYVRNDIPYSGSFIIVLHDLADCSCGRVVIANGIILPEQ